MQMSTLGLIPLYTMVTVWKLQQKPASGRCSLEQCWRTVLASSAGSQRPDGAVWEMV